MINIEVDRSPSSVLTGVPVFVSTLTVTGRYPGNYSYAVRNFFSPNSYKVATYEIMGMQLTILYMCLGGIQFRNNPIGVWAEIQFYVPTSSKACAETNWKIRPRPHNLC